MNEQNIPVEELPFESVQDDAAQAQGESLETLLTGVDTTAADAPAAEGATDTDPTPPAKEPGWIKARVNRAVEKAVAEAEARVSARYEARIAPLMEAVLDRQAQDLVAAGEFKTLERAKEYVRLKGGITDMPAPTQPTTPTPSTPARDAQGRFQSSAAPAASDAQIRARADILSRQAEKIKANRGLDVMQTFNANTEVRQKVISGEWDFHDVADYMSTSNPRVPSPIRSANGAGASAAATTIANMTDAQFARLEANLARGHRYKIE